MFLDAGSTPIGKYMLKCTNKYTKTIKINELNVKLNMFKVNKTDTKKASN